MTRQTICIAVAYSNSKWETMRGSEVNTSLKRQHLDSLDLAILEKMLSNGRIAFKELGEATNSDERTIASRFERMMRRGIVKRVTIEVDWSKIGLAASAYMGSTTALGEEDRKKLFEFIRREPRILEAEATIGAHEYFLKVVDVDIVNLRREICSPLEPLTVDLTTSIIAGSIKLPDYAGLFRYLRKKLLK